jgi:hypothetical protein
MYRRIEPSNWINRLVLHAALCDADLPVQNRKKWRYLENKSARFFFTEAGWQKYGHKTLGHLRSRGVIARVIVLKENDPRLNVIYRDRWQINVRFGGRKS